MTKAYVIEEGTTNHVPNPIFANDISGWAMANGTIERSTSRSLFGEASGLAISSGSLPRTSVSIDLPAITHHARAWIWHDLGANREFYLFVSALGGAVSGPRVTVPPLEWTAVDAEFIGAGIGEGGAFQIRLPSSVSGEQFFIGGAQIEAKPYPTSFVHGDMGEGYSWEGEPHNSPSIREPSSISMPSPEPKSLYIRYSEDGENWVNKYSTFDDEQEDVYPSLLLRPEGSYSWTPEDGVQEVTPNAGSGMAVVDGQYGDAWSGSQDSPFTYSLADNSDIAPFGRNTIIARARWSSGITSVIYPIGYGVSHTVIALGEMTSFGLRVGDPAEIRYTGQTLLPAGEWFSAAMVDDNYTAGAFLNGDRIHQASFTGSRSLTQIQSMRQGGGGLFTWEVESILVFPGVLSDAEIHRISTMPRAWTMENSISYKIRVPLGEHAELVRKDGELHLSTRKKLYIGTVIGFSRPLSQKEVAILDSTPLAYINGKTLLNLPDTTIGVSQLL